MRAVLDVSAAIPIVLGEMTAAGRRQMTRLESTLTVDLYHSESANALWRLCKAGQLEVDAAEDLLLRLADLPDEILPASAYSQRAFRLAVQHNHPAYDMFYLACAIENQCGLVSRDKALCRIAGALGILTLDPTSGT